MYKKEARRARGQAFFSDLVSRRPDVALCRASAPINRAVDGALKDLNLTSGEQLVLEMITATSPWSQQELSTHLRIDRSVMVGIIDSLEAARLVERRRDARDRRAYLITTTENGRLVLAEAQEAVKGVMDDVFAALTGEERDQLAALAAKLLFPADKD